ASTMIVGLSACGSSSSSSNPSSGSASGSTGGDFTSSGETLNVGVQSSVISIPVVYAEEQGYYDDLGLDVNIIVFPTGAPENEGLAAEQLDIASNGLASVYSLASGLCDWIGESDTGSTTVKIYAREDSEIFDHQGEISGKPDMYGSADTLKGMKILGPTSTLEQWAAVAYFSQFGLENGVDYEYTNMDKSAAAQAVIAGEGDLFVASDVNYCTMMENAGFKEVADCQDATDTVFNNGYLARKDIVNSRYDDVVLFLQATYKAAEELQNNPDKRAEFTLNFYNDNGKEATEEDVKEEIELRPYILAEDMQADEYYAGDAMIQVAEFFGSIEVIDEDQIENVPVAINVNPLQDALGITIQSAADK
ncbi:MAG: hypothetical protein Q4D42_13490, partial [Eubacteriales bacterium]|nr:hypothetical protein [Eubacteriales bacterium]